MKPVASLFSWAFPNLSASGRILIVCRAASTTGTGLSLTLCPGKKPGLQYVKLTTEVAGVELDSADSVWVAAR